MSAPYPTGCTQHCNDGADCTETTQHCKQTGHPTNGAPVDDAMIYFARVVYVVIFLVFLGAANFLWNIF